MSPEEWERLNAKQKAANRKLGTKQKMLSTVAQLATWGTPNTMDSMESRNLEQRKMRGGCSNLKDQASLLVSRGTPWPTPIAGDYKGQKRGPGKGKATMLCAVALLAGSGPTQNGSGSKTKNAGRLNAALARWLMGVPVAWDECAIRAHRSIQMRPRKQGQRESRDTETASSRRPRKRSSGLS
jgi:hypothetical protein